MANINLQKQIGAQIRSVREDRKMAQGKVAKQLGISVPALSKIENGVTDLNISRLAQIASLFNISMVELISQDIKMAPSNLLAQLEQLRGAIAAKDEEIQSLQKKVINLYEKLGL